MVCKCCVAVAWYSSNGEFPICPIESVTLCCVRSMYEKVKNNNNRLARLGGGRKSRPSAERSHHLSSQSGTRKGTIY